MLRNASENGGAEVGQKIGTDMAKLWERKRSKLWGIFWDASTFEPLGLLLFSTYYKMRTLTDIQKQLENQKARSCWARGVLNFAIDLVGDAIENNGADFTPSSSRELERLLLNGAENWEKYSRGGCALVSNVSIAEALCTPSELKKTKNGQRKPNKNEERLDAQARALWQACQKILALI